MEKRSAGEKAFNIINIVFMVFIIIVTVYPFWYVLVYSFSDPYLVMRNRGIILKPLGFSLEAYKSVLGNKMIIVGYKNTVINLTIGLLFNMFFTTIAAYALSRHTLLLKNYIMKAIVFTMYFSGGLIPNYLLIQQLGMMNTRWALIIPGTIHAMNLIIMRTAFINIPRSLEESAKIEGANDFVILWKIAIPLSLPTIAVIILYYGVGHWNAYFNAMIYIRDTVLYPLQLVLRDILIMNRTDSMSTGGGAGDSAMLSETIKYATIIVSTVPILVLYPFLQKYFVKGVMVGAIKE